MKYSNRKLQQKYKRTENKQTNLKARQLPFFPLLYDMTLQKTIGNHELTKLFEAAEIQAKLYINNPGDSYEKEADTLAGQIVSAGNTGIESLNKVHEVQKDVKKEKEGTIPDHVEAGIHTSQGQGQSLQKHVRDYFEPRFGVDLGNIRLHSDSNADRLTRAINARAFTLGNHIYVARGEYKPETDEGKKLLAHELTHVLQQNHSHLQPFRQAGAVIQRDIKSYTKKPVSKELEAIIGKINDCVQTAADLINQDPLLEGSDSYPEKSGHLDNWRTNFALAIKKPDEITNLFYAAYGYAVETIAFYLLSSCKYKSYRFQFNDPHGQTRPDIVVLQENQEVAWIDITSEDEAENEHIKRKQGSGWKTSDYVAEITYPKPYLSTFSKKTLSKDMKEMLIAACAAHEETEKILENGKCKIGNLIKEGLSTEFKATGKTPTKDRMWEIIKDICDIHLGYKDQRQRNILTASVLEILGEISYENEKGEIITVDAYNFAKNIFAIGRDKVNATALLVTFGNKSQ